MRFHHALLLLSSPRLPLLMMQKHGDLPALRTAEKQALLDLEAQQTAQIHAKLAQQYGEADRRASVLIGAAKARRERSDELLYKAEMAVIQEAKAVRAVEAATAAYAQAYARYEQEVSVAKSVFGRKSSYVDELYTRLHSLWNEKGSRERELESFAAVSRSLHQGSMLAEQQVRETESSIAEAVREARTTYKAMARAAIRMEAAAREAQQKEQVLAQTADDLLSAAREISSLGAAVGAASEDVLRGVLELSFGPGKNSSKP